MSAITDDVLRGIVAFDATMRRGDGLFVENIVTLVNMAAYRDTGFGATAQALLAERQSRRDADEQAENLHQALLVLRQDVRTAIAKSEQGKRISKALLARLRAQVPA